MGVTTTLLTVEEYAQLPEEETMRTELVEGEIVRMGDARVTESNLNTHQTVKANCIAILEDYIRQNPAWRLFSEDSPQLAFEAVSSESAAYLERKITLYRGAGFRAIWIAYPSERTLVTMHPNGRGYRLHKGQYIEEPDLLPGFRVLVDRFFDGI
jgi:Uma2 family endonuclease